MIYRCGLMQKDDIRQLQCTKMIFTSRCGLMQKDDIRQCGCVEIDNADSCGLMQKDDIRQYNNNIVFHHLVVV